METTTVEVTDYVLIKEVLDLYDLINIYKQKITRFSSYYYEKYPNADEVINIAEENKKLESKNLELYVKYGYPSKMYLLTTKNQIAYFHENSYSKFDNIINENINGINIYRKLSKLDHVFRFTVKAREYGDTTKEFIVDELIKSASRNKFEFRMSFIEFMGMCKEIFNEALPLLKDDYAVLSGAKELHLHYKDLFNSVSPTGDYAGIVEYLSNKGLKLERLEIVDGKVIDFSRLYLNTGNLGFNVTTKKIVFVNPLAFDSYKYDVDEGLNCEPNDVLNSIERKMEYLQLIKDNAILSNEIIGKINEIKNVNYYLKETKVESVY